MLALEMASPSKARSSQNSQNSGLSGRSRDEQPTDGFQFIVELSHGYWWCEDVRTSKVNSLGKATGNHVVYLSISIKVLSCKDSHIAPIRN